MNTNTINTNKKNDTLVGGIGKEAVIKFISEKTDVIKFVQVDMWIDKPYIMVGRIQTKSVLIRLEEERLQIKTMDKFKTTLVNVPLDAVCDMDIVKYSDTDYEIRFKLEETKINYKVWIEL